MKRISRLGILSVLLISLAFALQACAGTREPATAAVTASPGSTEGDVAGVWTGSYVCLQGPTGLRLSLQATTEGGVGGTFEFYALPSNPGVPGGSFRMEGRYSGAELVLHGGEWIDQPTGYETVGLSGTVSRELGTFEGEVLHPSCSTFSLRRSE